MYRFKRFPNNPLIVDSEYELDTIKGFGSYGLVASGRCISTQQEIAIKKISHVFDNLGDARRVLR